MTANNDASRVIDELESDLSFLDRAAEERGEAHEMSEDDLRIWEEVLIREKERLAAWEKELEEKEALLEQRERDLRAREAEFERRMQAALAELERRERELRIRKRELELQEAALRNREETLLFLQRVVRAELYEAMESEFPFDDTENIKPE